MTPSPGLDETRWLVDTPQPLDWASVRALNEEGIVVSSRAVLQDPPSFCGLTQVCGDDGPLPGAQDVTEVYGLSATTGYITAAAGIGALALLQVALFAGPAFAVSLRRRQRDLGLVAANGGTAADLRRAILSSAITLGVFAAGAALLAAWLVGYAIKVLSERFGLLAWPDPVMGRETPVFALVAILAALVAAWLPARVAARTDVLHALRGRRPAGPLTRRIAAIGVGLTAGGIVLVAGGAVLTESISLTIGLFVFQIGIIVLIPWVVAAVARAAARLPVALRLAARDGDRQRIRTVSAVSAVAAASMVAGAVLISTTSNSAGQKAFYVPFAQPGVVLTEIGYAGGRPTDEQVAEAITFMRQKLAELLPGASVGAARHLTGARKHEATYALFSDGCAVLEDGTPLDENACPRPPSNGRQSGVVQADETWYSAITGDDTTQARDMLRTGGVIALDAAPVHDGSVLLVTTRRGRGDTQSVEARVERPAYVAPSSVFGPRLVLGPTAELPPDWRPEKGVSLAVIPPPGVDPTQAAGAVTAARTALRDASHGRWGAGSSGLTDYVERGFQGDDLRSIAAIALLSTLGLALIAALTVTALALSDGRPDLTIMAAVGGPPRARRGYAAATALVIAGIGTLVGVVASAVPGWALARLLTVAMVPTAEGDTRLVTAADFFTVPWAPVLAMAVGIPLITAAAAWLFTRGRIPMTRRGH